MEIWTNQTMKEKLKINKLVQDREIGKMIKKKIFFVLFLFMICVQPLISDTGLINVSVDKREVVLGKSITLTVEIDSRIANDYKQPKMTDFIVVPKKSISKNGKHVYIYTLSPKEVGYSTIPKIEILDNVSSEIKIKVNEPVSYSTKTKKYSEKNENIFVKAQTDLTSVYINQQMTYTLQFYTKFDLASNPSYTLPMFQDFWKSKPKVKSGYKLINGENYFTFEVSTQLYPMKDGNIIIDSATVSVVSLEYGDVANFQKQSEFENGKKINRNLQADAIKLKVYPLPEVGKPDNFSGAVGRYKISAYVDKNIVMVNEPVNLNISITGDGNINSVVEPEIILSEDIQKYATTYKVKDEGWQSTKSFQCVLIPLMEGNKVIPEISFSYFSPDLRDYVTIKTSKIEINVKEGNYVKKEEDTDNVGKDNQSQIEDKQINDIEKNIKIKNYTFSFINNKVLLIIIIAPFVILVTLSLIYRLKIIYINFDKIKLSKQRAYSQSIKCLKDAEMAISKKDQNAFYFNINLAARLFLQSKTNVNYVNMLKEDIKLNLEKNKISDEYIDDIEKILTDCEFFKFTSVQSTVEYMNKTYNNLKNIMEQLDKFYEKNSH
jgi:hypothetical protein